MNVKGTVGIVRTEQRDAGADGRGPIGHLKRLSASLRRDGDPQASASVELIGEVDDQPGFSRARR
jgi:hypothetical protein